MASVAVFATPCQAAETHLFQSTFNASDAPSGAAAPLGSPLGLAVDNSGTASDGRIYIGDTSRGVVDVFGPTGNYISQLGGFNLPYGVAVDQSNGDLYAADLGGAVDKFDSAGNVVKSFAQEGRLLGGSTPQGNLVEPTGVAVDPSSGDLYVAASREALIDVFKPNGEYVRQFTSIPSVYILAIDSQGNLFAANGSEVMVFKTATGAINTAYGGGSGVLDSGSSIGVGVDPATNDVYVADGDHIAEFDSAGNFISNFGQGHLGGVRDVGVGDGAAKVYVSNQSSANAAIFGPPVAVPDVSTGPVINPGQTSGTLTGHLDPAGAGNATACQFEYGPNTSYGSEVPCTPAAPYSTATDVQAVVSSLTNEVTYHYRLVVTNANGTNYGQDRVYTPHSVLGLITEAATLVTADSARLHASFVGNGEDTHYYFQWGTDTNYGQTTATPPGVDAGSGSGPTTEFADLTHLTPQTTYHFRVVASNSTGLSLGEDQKFTTPPAVTEVATNPPTNVTPTSATLNGSYVGNGEDTHYYFEWGTNTEYGHVTATPPGQDAGSATGSQGVAANLGELSPATSYDYRLVATNSAGSTVGGNQQFVTPPAIPAVSESVSDVNSDSALLHAQINPGGGETKYHFEYATASEFEVAEEYGQRTPENAIAAQSTPVGVAAQLGDLAPGTTYHWRVVAVNATGETTGPDRIFTTYPFTPVLNDPCSNAHVRQQTGAAFLLDCRAYELVSAANAGGFDVESDLVPGQTPFPGYPEAGSPSSRVLYGMHDGGIPGTDDPTDKGVDPYVATRGEGGWSTSYVGISADNPFSALPFSSVPTGADASLDTFAFGGPGGCSPCFEGGYTGVPVRLANGELAQGMVPSPGVPAPGPSVTADGYIAKDLSADGTHLIFGSTSRFAPGGNDGSGDVSIYDRNLQTGETHVVSNSPGSEDFPTPLACLQGAGNCHSPADSNGIAELDISRNGSRILLAQKVSTDADGNVYYHLYMNLGDSINTVDLTPGASHGVLYDGMSEDGSQVYFTTSDQLSGADTDTSADMYRADVSAAGGLTLTPISGGEAPAGNTDSCDPVSNSIGAHWDTVGAAANCDVVAVGGGGGVAASGGSAYFLSPEQLEAGKGTPDQPNLYLAAFGSSPRYVTTLAPNDPVVLDSVKEATRRRTADFQVSASGVYSVFGTTLPLEPNYDNAGFSEIYRYDTASKVLTCVSCDPTGVEPSFGSSLASNGLSLTEDGRVFFTSAEPLVARDQDHRKDAYEWEGGKVELISAGSSPFDSGLLSASADGRDIYFFTRDNLAPQDHNGPTMKIYDAREGGGFPYVPPAPLCAASDECHGAGSPAPGPTTIRTVVGGPGNAEAEKTKKCKSGLVRKHGQCVRKPHHHHHHKTAHRRVEQNRGGEK